MKEQVSLADQVERPVDQFTVLLQTTLGRKLPLGFSGYTEPLFADNKLVTDTFYVRMCYDQPTYGKVSIGVFASFVAKKCQLGFFSHARYECFGRKKSTRQVQESRPRTWCRRERSALGRAVEASCEGEARAGGTGMSAFETWLLVGLGSAVLALLAVASAIDKLARHLSNVADRLLDIDRTLNGRR